MRLNEITNDNYDIGKCFVVESSCCYPKPTAYPLLLNTTAHDDDKLSLSSADQTTRCDDVILRCRVHHTQHSVHHSTSQQSRPLVLTGFYLVWILRRNIVQMGKYSEFFNNAIAPLPLLTACCKCGLFRRPYVLAYT